MVKILCEGRLVFVGYFNDGEPFGHWTEYTEDGQPRRICRVEDFKMPPWSENWSFCSSVDSGFIHFIQTLLPRPSRHPEESEICGDEPGLLFPEDEDDM